MMSAVAAHPATDWRPVRPPRLEREAADFARVASLRRGPLRLGGLELRVVPAPPAIPAPVRLAVSLGGAEGRLTLPRPLLDDLLAEVDPAAPAATDDAACLLLELAFEAALGRFEAGDPGRAVALRPAPDDSWAGEAALGLACQLRDGVAFTARLDLPWPAARILAAALRALPTERRPLPGLHVPLRLRALATDLPLADLRGLAAGDVVLAEPPAPGELLLVAGERLGWRARQDGRRVQATTPRLLLRAAGLGEWTVGDATDDDPPAAALEELPIRLTFEVGRLEVPLGELEAIGPGYVLELGRDDAGVVDILANGRRVGRGELVEVAGARGVRVLWIGRDG